MDYSKFLGSQFGAKAKKEEITLTYAQQYFNDHKDKFEEFFRIRIWRALSWMKKAQTLDNEEDQDLRFITLWIAFNALYGKDLSSSMCQSINENSSVKIFLSQICNFDKSNEINTVLLSKGSREVLQSIAENQYTFYKFWKCVNTQSSESWQDEFESDKDKLIKFMREGNTTEILFRSFNRMYTLRNQIMHGGSTFGSYLNRNQVKDASDLLSVILPIIMVIMMSNYSEQCDFGMPFYMPQK